MFMPSRTNRRLFPGTDKPFDSSQFFDLVRDRLDAPMRDLVGASRAEGPRVELGLSFRGLTPEQRIRMHGVQFRNRCRRLGINFEGGNLDISTYRGPAKGLVPTLSRSIAAGSIATEAFERALGSHGADVARLLIDANAGGVAVERDRDVVIREFVDSVILSAKDLLDERSSLRDWLMLGTAPLAAEFRMGGQAPSSADLGVGPAVPDDQTVWSFRETIVGGIKRARIVDSSSLR